MNDDIQPVEGALMTIEELERLPDDGWRYELVRGRLVREPLPGYEHGRVAGRLAVLIGSYLRDHEIGEMLTGDPGFVLQDDPPTVRGPDLAFVAADRVPEETRGYGRFAPDLAVEVVSPSNRPSQIQQKVLDYLDAGSRLVWVVDPEVRTVTMYRSRREIRILGEDDELDGGEVLPGFRVRLAEVFAPAR